MSRELISLAGGNLDASSLIPLGSSSEIGTFNSSDMSSIQIKVESYLQKTRSYESWIYAGVSASKSDRPGISYKRLEFTDQTWVLWRGHHIFIGDNR